MVDEAADPAAQDFRALGRGSLEFLHPENRRVLVFIREYAGERILVAANLSRFVQAAELDLSRYQGCRPVEMFGRAEFPAVTERPYLLSLGPHAFYWLSLEPRTSAETLSVSPRARDLPTLHIESWDDVLTGEVRRTVERMLPGLLVQARWYLGRLRRVRTAEMADVIPLPGTSTGIVCSEFITQTATRSYIRCSMPSRAAKRRRIC